MMTCDIKIKRLYRKDTYTIGKLYIGSVYVCDTLEDKDRGLTSDMSVEEIKSKKIYGQTAIPSGKYEMVIDYSPKYRKNMPHILNVKGYDGIRIHSGNTADDSLGCILVGKNKEKGKVVDSRNTYQKLMDFLSPYDKFTVTIE